MACYNSENTIKDTLTSILEQDHFNIEIIIVDGLSSDDTVSIVHSFQRSSQNIKFISEKDRGIYDALNKGINLSTGQIIGFLHSDDVFYSKTIISEIVKLLDKHVDGLYGDLNYISKNTKKIIRKWKGIPYDYNNLKKGWMPAHPTLFLKKDVYHKYGLFDLKYTISSDYDFMIRILKDNSLKFIYYPKLITNMRIGGTSNNSFKNIKIKILEDYKIIKNHNIGGIFTLIRKNFSKIKQYIHF